MALNEDFKKAADQAQKLGPQSNETLLKLYALYKQSTVGDVQGDRPGMLKLRDRAKWDAWAQVKGQSQAQAQQAYVALVGTLS